MAAVCYRLRHSRIEFLLVQTRNAERWTFPKGCAEPGLTHAQAAALEAFEEAGVHGRIEEARFTQYRHRKGRSLGAEFVVSAHLCEVRKLDTPHEADRHPTWFSAEKAKQRLREDRKREFGADLARVIDRAVARIQRLHRLGETRLKAVEATPVTALALVRGRIQPALTLVRRSG